MLQTYSVRMHGPKKLQNKCVQAFFFLEFKTTLSHSYSSNKQLFWTPPIFPDQAHVCSGGKYTHTQGQTEKSLAQEYFYFN